MSTFLIFLFSFLSSGEMTPDEETTLEVVASSTASSVIQQEENMTTYYFIRHAEKDEKDPKNKDPFLTEAGIERAEKWAEIFNL